MDPELMAVATGAAANLTADIFHSAWPRARAALARVLSHGSAAEQRDALSRAQGQQQALASGRSMSQTQVQNAWEQFFIEFGERHSDSLPALRELAQIPGSTMKIQRNEASGTFIGGNVYGGLTVNQGGTDASSAR